jgi:hypothetical protein
MALDGACWPWILRQEFKIINSMPNRTKSTSPPVLLNRETVEALWGKPEAPKSMCQVREIACFGAVQRRA